MTKPAKFKPGLWLDENGKPIGLEAYHADFSAIGHSMIDVSIDSTRRFEAMFVSQTIKQEPSTAAHRLGSLKHLGALQPERWDEFVEVIPSVVLASNGAKSTNAYKDFAAKRPGKILIKDGELDHVRAMIEALHGSERSGALMSDAGPCEQPIRWIDEETGLVLKSMRDKVACNGTLLVDLKSCADPSEEAFAKAAGNYGYYRQAAHYLDGHAAVTGTPAVGMVFIAVGKEPPHDVGCYGLHAEDIEAGREQNRAALRRLAQCYETGDWSNAREKYVQVLKIPNYLMRPDQWRI